MSQKARLRLRFDGPTFPAGFKCAGVLVTGEAIPSEEKSESNVAWQSIYAGEVCPYAGLSTVASNVAGQTELEFSLYVPGARKTTVQVLGIETTGDCPKPTLGKLLSAKKAGTLPTEIKGIYELGRQTIPNLKSEVVVVEKNYDPAKSKNLLNCNAGTSGGNLFPYKALTLFPGDRYLIKPTGGTPPYAFSNSGTGTVNQVADEAEFIAGVTGQDIVTISDSATPALTSNVTFTVAAAIVPSPMYWYSARHFVPLAEGTTIATNWVNSGSALDDLVPAGGSKTIKRNAAPNGMPAVGIASGASFSKLTSTSFIGNHSVLGVARRLDAATVSFFCFSELNCSSGNQYSLMKFRNTTAAARFEVSNIAYTAYAEVTPVISNEGWSLFEGHFQAAGSPIDLTFRGETVSQPHLLSIFGPGTGHIRVGGIDVTGAESAFEVAEVIGILGTSTTTVGNTLRAKYSLP